MTTTIGLPCLGDCPKCEQLASHLVAARVECEEWKREATNQRESAAGTVQNYNLTLSRAQLAEHERDCLRTERDAAIHERDEAREQLAKITPVVEATDEWDWLGLREDARRVDQLDLAAACNQMSKVMEEYRAKAQETST